MSEWKALSEEKPANEEIVWCYMESMKVGYEVRKMILAIRCEDTGGGDSGWCALYVAGEFWKDDDIKCWRKLDIPEMPILVDGLWK